MEIIRLDNVGRRFKNLVNTDEIHGSRNIFGHLRTDDNFWALRNINLSVNKGEIVGVIGRNGSGKTTLLNIVAGVLPVSEGKILLKGKISALLTVGATFQCELTGKENTYFNASLLGFTKSEIEKQFADILEFSELGSFINAPLGSYSAGMRMRLGFSIAIHKNFDILVTDEIIMVGDIAFQKKCFEKMLEFKKQGKSMIIATQEMTTIEKFCDKVYLLEDGQSVFNGTPAEAIARYQKLLNKKRVLFESSRSDIVKETKRWIALSSEWDKREGTGEVAINEVLILNKWRQRIDKVKCGDRIIIRVNFKANEEVGYFHFGVAIFREDGVYCYGPNTKFDGLSLGRMSKGDGYFELEYNGLLLMAGIYFLSIAIWEENESFAYDYHKGKYEIEIVGDSLFGQLLNLPSKWDSVGIFNNFMVINKASFPNLGYLENTWGKQLDDGLTAIKSIKCFDNYGSEESVFLTGREMKIKIDFEIDKLAGSYLKNLIIWIGIYRSDGIYCQGRIKKIFYLGARSEILIYPKLNLLPGGYMISAGIWNLKTKKFLTYSHGIHPFNMISRKKDHGTVYLEHRWNWKIPGGR